MKKILVLTPRFPYPVIGGDRLRIYKICEELSKKYSLTLLSLCDSIEEMSYQPSDKVFSEIHRIYHPKRQAFINVMKALPTSVPLQVAYYKSDEYNKKLKEIVGDFDATLSHLIRVGDYVKDLDGIHILEMTDAISMNYERVKKNASLLSFKSILYSIEFSRLNKYEKKIFKNFSLTSIISPIDLNYLSPSQKDNVIVCGNGVDINKYEFLNRRIVQNNPINLVFIGNLYSLQNYDGIMWFIKNIFSKLNCKGEYRLHVLGKIRPKDKKRLEKFKNVIVSGAVDDIQVAAYSGHVGICPIRLGAGVQNKVLEYMALGMPVITSRIGYEGINAVLNEEIFVADNLDEYKIALNKIKDENVYRTVAEKARYFVEYKFKWSFQLSKLIAKIEELLKNDSTSHYGRR